PKTGWKTFWAVARGLLFALPLLIFLGALLASADPIFARWLEEALGFIEDWPQYVWRGFIILVLAYVLLGAYLFALNRSEALPLLGAEKPLMAPFVGFTEAVTMLGSV